MTTAAELLAEARRDADAAGRLRRWRWRRQRAPRVRAPRAAPARARGADEVVVETARRTDGTTGAYVFARWGTPRRIINAHVDTVPANAGWSRSPWSPHVAGGKLYGLGAADTKGAIAATLVALDAAKPRDLGVLFSGDEESGSAVMHAAFLASPHARDVREAIVCEPTQRCAGVAHRGVLAQTASFEGAGGHSSKADFMPKPIATLARLAVALDELGRARIASGPPGMQGLCLNLAALHGGVAFNVVPQRAVLEWSLRPYPGFDRAAWDARDRRRRARRRSRDRDRDDDRSSAVSLRAPRRAGRARRAVRALDRQPRLLDRGRAARRARQGRDRDRPRRYRAGARRRRVRRARRSRLGRRAVPNALGARIVRKVRTLLAMLACCCSRSASVAGARADDVRLPPGTRKDAATGELVSGRGLRDTTDFIAKELSRNRRDRRRDPARPVPRARRRGHTLHQPRAEHPVAGEIHVLHTAGKTLRSPSSRATNPLTKVARAS